MARVLLADTNFSAGPIRQALRKRGHEVFVVGGNPQDFLAKSTPGYIQADYSDPERLATIAEEHAIDFLLPGCNDVSYISCVQAQALLGRSAPGLDDERATDCLNRKDQFRSLGREAGLNTPEVFAEAVVPDCAVIVKPVDAFSGKGVSVIASPTADSLSRARQLAEQESSRGRCIVERYLEGQLYSHSAFYRDGKMQADFFVVEHGSANPYVVDTSCVTDLSPAVSHSARTQADTLVAHLALADGVLHTQFIACDDKAWPIEVTRRCPGDLYSLLIKLSTGFDYPWAYASAFIGEPCEAFAQPRQQNWVMRHTLTVPQSCPLGSVEWKHSLPMRKWVPLAVSGDHLRPSPYSRIAILFAQFDSASTLQEAMQITIKRDLYEVVPDA